MCVSFEWTGAHLHPSVSRGFPTLEEERHHYKGSRYVCAHVSLLLNCCLCVRMHVSGTRSCKARFAREGQAHTQCVSLCCVVLCCVVCCVVPCCVVPCCVVAVCGGVWRCRVCGGVVCAPGSLQARRGAVTPRMFAASSAVKQARDAAPMLRCQLCSHLGSFSAVAHCSRTACHWCCTVALLARARRGCLSASGRCYWQSRRHGRCARPVALTT